MSAAEDVVPTPEAQMVIADPAKAIDHFLQLNEDRDLEAASRFFAPGATLHWPGGVVYDGLASMVGAAAGRYEWVRKHRDTYAVGTDEDGSVVVTSRGRLYGVNLQGVPFEDIRYVDVFVIVDGAIVEQHVWNDLPVSDVLTRGEA